MRWRLSSALRREERKGQGGTLCLCGLGVISGQEEPAASLLCCCDCMTPGMRGEVGRKDVEELTFGGGLCHQQLAEPALVQSVHEPPFLAIEGWRWR